MRRYLSGSEDGSGVENCLDENNWSLIGDGASRMMHVQEFSALMITCVNVAGGAVDASGFVSLCSILPTLCGGGGILVKVGGNTEKKRPNKRGTSTE